HDRRRAPRAERRRGGGPCPGPLRRCGHVGSRGPYAREGCPRERRRRRLPSRQLPQLHRRGGARRGRAFLGGRPGGGDVRWHGIRRAAGAVGGSEGDVEAVAGSHPAVGAVSMAGPCLVLFDGRIARDWQPFTLTRPAGELRFGALTLRERAQRVLGADCIGHLAGEDLVGFEEPEARPVLAPDGIQADRGVVYLVSRAVPSWSAAPIHYPDHPALLRIGGEAAGWFAPAGSPPPPREFFDDPARHAPSAPEIALDGFLLERIWHLVTHNAEQVARDIAALFPAAERPELPAGVHVVGDAPLILGAGAEIEPGAVIDLRHGPVWLDEGASVAAFSKVSGPSYIGRGTAILGGPVAAVSIGPVCKVHGEVEESVILGYSNKAHDGFLGHSYVGCWVNL